MITTTDRKHAIRALVDLHGQRLGLDAGSRISAVYVALVEYQAEGYVSAHRALEAGREVLDDIVAWRDEADREVGHG